MKCRGCGRVAELRMGYCFDCVMNGEERSAKRTVLQHLRRAVYNILRGRADYARFDLKWAFERFFRVGDYADGGYFDYEGHQWR